jgi:peptide/nickel transport system ATP-binding protein
VTAALDAASPEVQGPPTKFLEVRDLVVHFPTDDGLVRSVDGLSFGVERGRTLGIVGESGSGKSVTSQAIMGLHNGTKARLSGQIWLDGEDILTLSQDEMRRLRGQKVAMVFQDPLSSLHPFYKIGDQIVEAYRVHNKVSKAEARKRAIEMLDRVGIPHAAKRFEDYPHQFSGGMRQRAMIAMALVCDPQLIIADEPTTALDVTVQAQILELMLDLQREFNSAIIIITHDLGVIAEIADEVVVMYGGRCVEQGDVREVFYNSEMPYTWGLLRSMPRMDRARKVRLDPIEGTPPSLINLPKGCVFSPRCHFKDRVGVACTTQRPELKETTPAHQVRCHIPPEERRRIWAEEIRPAL